MSHRHDLRDRWCWQGQLEREAADVEREIEAPFESDAGDPRWGTGGMRSGASRRLRASQPQDKAEGEPLPSYSAVSPYGPTRGPYVGRGPRGYRRSDERIREEVCDRFTEHGDLDPTDVEVGVRGGEVVLVGTVSTRAQKRLAEAIVEAVFGVVEVQNHLRVPSAAAADRPGPLHGDTQDGPVRDNGVVHR